MAGGWQTGLGQGLQNVGNTISDYSKQRIMMQQQALENALRQKQFEESQAERQDTRSWRESQMKRDEEQSKREQATQHFNILGSLEEGTRFKKDELAGVDPLVLKATMQQDQNLPTSRRFGADMGQGLAIQSGEQGDLIPDQYRSVPPMSEKIRIATMNQQSKDASEAGKLQRLILTLNNRDAASQRSTQLRRDLAAATNQVDYARIAQDLLESDRELEHWNQQAKLGLMNSQLRGESNAIRRARVEQGSTVTNPFDKTTTTTPGIEIKTPRPVIPTDPAGILINPTRRR